MGKWFQRKNFSTKKWRQDPNARKAHRVLGILLAAAVVFQVLPLGGIAVSASENGGAVCVNIIQNIRRTAAIWKDIPQKGSVPMSIQRTVIK